VKTIDLVGRWVFLENKGQEKEKRGIEDSIRLLKNEVILFV